MLQVQIPVAPVANISMASAAWRRVLSGRNFFQFLHGSSQQGLVWALKFSTVMPVQHVFQYVRQLALKSLFYHLF
jgi:hypothetical protein